MTEPNHTKIEERIPALVDGTLDEAEQIELLNLIDTAAPEAWRRLALAYVEADFLRAAFREEAEVPSDSIALIPEQRKRTNTGKTMVIAAAAALLLGLFMGAVLVPDKPSPVFVTNQPTPPQKEAAFPASSSSFQAIESLDVALRSQGIEPTISTAVYQTQLPDGRQLYLPIQTLSVTR